MQEILQSSGPIKTSKEATHLNDNLQATLTKLIQSGSWSNPALHTIFTDYVKYHVVAVIADSFFVAIVILLNMFFWTHWKKTPQTDTRKWTFEKRTYFAFRIMSGVVGLLITFVVVVNVITLIHPRPGFSLLVDELGTPKAGTPMAQLYQSFNTWLQSGSTTMPSLVQSKLDERIAFNTIIVIVSSIVLVVCVALSTLIWRTLLKRSRVREAKWRLQERALLVSGVATVAFSLLMLGVFEKYLQGALYPITWTLAFG
ncbi:MAG: hypothetical protein H0X24_16295 [Ktedonobacterales bacterium]|nr:hypothetical protein [Ktedonobacterales bacterium]